MNSIEDMIISLEKKQKENLNNLQSSPTSPSLIKELGENQKKIEILYTDLDATYKKFDIEKNKFDISL